jgi:hypothetical protein
VTKRKPLEWHDATVSGVGVGHKLPGCSKCCDLLFMPGFTEAVYSVGIEHPGDPADLAKRAIESYHARRHPAAEWGLG